MKTVLKPALFVAVLAQLSCTHDAVSPPPPLPDGTVLYMSVDGGSTSFSGMLTLNANSLEIIDSLSTGSNRPSSFALSSDYTEWYAVWQVDIGDFDGRSDLHEVDVASKNVSTFFNVVHDITVLDHNQNHVICGGGASGLTIYDRNLLSVMKDTTVKYAATIVPSRISSRLYIAEFNQGLFLVTYNTDSLKIERRMELPVWNPYAFAFGSMVISPDEATCYLTTYNPLGGYGDFYAIDIDTGSEVDKELCGGGANMAVSSDGKYVYLSDPAGYLYQDVVPTKKILRYDTPQKKMETLINGFPKELNISGATFETDQIQIAEDNRTLFVTLLWVGIRNSEDKLIQILKLDALTGELIDSYALPPRYDGYALGTISTMRLAKYPF